MKILIASDTYIYQTNGVLTVLITLVDGLRQLGYEVKVLAPANGRESFQKGDDYFIRSLPAPYYPNERLCLVHWDPMLDDLISWKPDIVHFHTEGLIGRLAIRVAKKSKATLVVTSHTDFAKFVFGNFHDLLPVRAVCKALGKLYYPHVRAIIVPSEKSKSYSWLRDYSDHVTVISNGIRLERFQKPVSGRAALLQQHGLMDNGFTLVMVTRVSREKNIIEILRYFPALLRVLPDAQLVIVGDGPDRKRLERYCVRNGLSECVRFTGRVGLDDVYRYYALGDVFVSASTFETQGLTYIEAMACGLPMVCRKDICLKNVLENGRNGFVYETEQEFTEVVRRVLTDEELKKAMSEEALSMVKAFSDNIFVERTVALYEKVIQMGMKDKASSPDR